MLSGRDDWGKTSNTSSSTREASYPRYEKDIEEMLPLLKYKHGMGWDLQRNHEGGPNRRRPVRGMGPTTIISGVSIVED